MADYGNLESDSESNEDIDHIPKTPGPLVMSDGEQSSDEKSGDERSVEQNKSSDSDANDDSDSSDEQNSANDSEVERSDNENEDINDNNDKQKNINDLSSDDNDNDNEHENNANNESINNDNESDDQTEQNQQIISNRKRKTSKSSESSDDSDDNMSNIKKSKSDNESDNEDDDEVTHSKAKAKDIFGEMSSEEDEEDVGEDAVNTEHRKRKSSNEEENHSNKDSSDEENVNDRDMEIDDNNEQPTNQINNDNAFIEDEEQQEEEVVPETRIEVEIPRIVADLGNEMHFVKLPNFLSIDTHPYDPQWYEDEIDEDEVLDDEGRARLKLKVENTIRWRNVYDKDSGELVKESNARVVRWSDGTFSLHLGDEIFDIHKLQLMPGDNNHLFVRQGTGLQGQAVFRTKLTFRPFSTESFTHRKLTLSLADRSQKTQKIRVLPNVGKDPEAHRSEMIKKEEDRLKASIRRENKMRRVRERSLIRGPTASYLEPDAEDDDEEEGISISKIKNQYKRGTSYNKYQDDADSGEESKPANDDDDSDLDIFDKRKSSNEGKKKSAQIVESDDE